MNELIAMFALNYFVENTTNGRDKMLSRLSEEDIALFTDWAVSTEARGADVIDAALEIIVNKVNELKGI